MATDDKTKKGVTFGENLFHKYNSFDSDSSESNSSERNSFDSLSFDFEFAGSIAIDDFGDLVTGKLDNKTSSNNSMSEKCSCTSLWWLLGYKCTCENTPVSVEEKQPNNNTAGAESSKVKPLHIDLYYTCVCINTKFKILKYQNFIKSGTKYYGFRVVVNDTPYKIHIKLLEGGNIVDVFNQILTLNNFQITCPYNFVMDYDEDKIASFEDNASIKTYRDSLYFSSGSTELTAGVYTIMEVHEKKENTLDFGNMSLAINSEADSEVVTKDDRVSVTERATDFNVEAPVNVEAHVEVVVSEVVVSEVAVSKVAVSKVAISEVAVPKVSNSKKVKSKELSEEKKKRIKELKQGIYNNLWNLKKCYQLQIQIDKITSGK